MNYPTLNEWLDIMYLSDEEEAMHRKHIPADWVAVDSEDDKQGAFSAIQAFFGKRRDGTYKVCAVSEGEIVRLSKGGLKIIVTGEMTWTAFMHPTTLSRIVASGVSR